MELETFLAIAVHFCIGHAWFSYVRNGPRHVIRLGTKVAREKLGRETYTLSTPKKALILLFWAFVAPNFWPIDVINTARKGYINKL